VAEISIRADVRQLQRAGAVLERNARTLIQRYVPDFRKRLALAQRQMIENVSGRILKRRSGTLARSIAFTLEETSTGLKGEVGVTKEGPAQRYAGIHITGGTITPRRARYLAIPLAPAALTPAGVPRFSSPRQVSGLFVIRSKAGNLLLVRRHRRGLQPFFLLVRSVTIPQRDYFSGPRQELIVSVKADLVEFLKELFTLKK
jgi:phage gpG-like protein